MDDVATLPHACGLKDSGALRLEEKFNTAMDRNVL